jgi:hypothetical protein
MVSRITAAESYVREAGESMKGMGLLVAQQVSWHNIAMSLIDPGRPILNEFYKKGCQAKSSSSTGGREDFCLEIQPTDGMCPSIALERFCSGLFALPVGFIFRW